MVKSAVVVLILVLLLQDAVAYDQSVPQRDAELVYMTSRYIGETDPDLKQVYFDELVDFVSDRQHIDHSIRKSISLWLQDEASVKELYKVMPGIPGNLNLAVAGLDAIQSELINTPVGRSETKQVSESLDPCH